MGLIVEEQHTHWQRTDGKHGSGHAVIEKQRTFSRKPGDMYFMRPKSIHSVENNGRHTGFTLQVYGKHPSHTGRLQFDVATQTARPCIFQEPEPSEVL